MLDGLRSWLRPALDVLAGDGDPAARTVAAIQALIEAYEAHRDQAPTYLQALAQAPVSEPLRAGVISLWAELRSLLAHDMDEMKRAGELPAWIDPTAMSAVLVAVANGFILQVAIDPEGPTLPALTARLASLLLAVRKPS